MTDIVLSDNGCLDKYIGDALMAIYGAPVVDVNHPRLACQSALTMIQTLRELRVAWSDRGLPLVDIGIGINTGNMVVGNMGSAARFDYTVMGDEVNLASRLEGANKHYGTNIIVSEATWNKVRDQLQGRELDVIRVKGKKDHAASSSC